MAERINIAMKEIILTDPFSGIDFKAHQFEDNSLVAVHPLTGETMRIRYDHLKNAFMLPAETLEHIPAVTLSQAAAETGLTLQRISNACKSGRIPFKKLPNGSKMILKKDLDDFSESKKNGRPRKEN